MVIEMINKKARQTQIDAKCRWRSDQLDGAVSYWEPLRQMKSTRGRHKTTKGQKPMKLVV